MEVRTDIKSYIFISSSSNCVCLYTCAYLPSSCILISQGNVPFSILTSAKTSFFLLYIYIYIYSSEFICTLCLPLCIYCYCLNDGSWSTRELKKTNKTLEAYFIIISTFDLTKKKRGHPESIYK